MFGQPSTPFGGFGQQPNTTPAFGATPAPAGGLFGATTTPAPAFGQPTSGFGATTGAFGAPAAPSGGLFGVNTGVSTFGTGGFGAPAPAPAFGAPAAGGGLFGSSAPAATFGSPAPVFGAPTGGGLFGSAPQPSTSLFGNQPQQQPTFGGSNAFGAAPAPATFGSPAPGVFGAPAPGGLFGAPAPAFGSPAPSAFGAVPGLGTTGGGLFGNTSTSAFGVAPTPAFGVPAPAPSVFGAPAPSAGGIFGASTFGSPAPSQLGGNNVSAVGTRAVSYQPTSRQDQNSSTPIVMQDITAMPEYEKKSSEELRFEDYSQGNRGTVAPMSGGFGGAPATGLFGSPAPAPGGFGTFGAAAPVAPFGGTNVGAFGSPAPASGGLFGAPAPAAAPFSFSGAPAPAPTGGLFGSPAAAPTFGSTPAAPAPFGAFGATAPAPSGLFGSTTTGAFGSSAPGGMFGSTAPAPFGAPAPSGGLFGSLATPAPASFGAPASSGGLFGQPAPAPAFGQSAPAGGLFGAPAPAPTAFGNTAFGGFGASAAPAPFGSLAPSAGFGLSSPQPAFGQLSTGGIQQQQQVMQQQPISIFPPNVQVIPPAQTEMLEQQLRALEYQRKELDKTDVWRGSATKRPVTTPTNMPNPFNFSPSPTASPLFALNQRASSTKMKPRGVFVKSSPLKSGDTPTQSRRDARGVLVSPLHNLRTNALQLVLRPESMKPASRLSSLRLENPMASPTAISIAESVTGVPVENGIDDVDTAATTLASGLDAATPSPSIHSPLASTSPGFNYYQKVIASTREENDSGVNHTSSSTQQKTTHIAPILTKVGYEVTPSMDQLSGMSEADLAAVLGFTIARPGYGKVEWEGAVDVRSANLDCIVSIDTQDISVYSEEEDAGTKPQVGSKLNRPAVLTFYGVFPQGGGSHSSDEDLQKFALRVKRSTEKLGAEFLSYDIRTGMWKMRVHHFSRYGLLADDEDEEQANTREMVSMKRANRSQSRLSSRQPTPFKPSHVSVQGLDESESADMDDGESYHDSGAIVSDVEMSEAEIIEKVKRDAENAFREVYSVTKQQRHLQVAKLRVDVEYGNEGADLEPIIADAYPNFDSYPLPSFKFSITSKLIQQVGASKSEVCYGIRMGRSFRISWLPDGSFIKLNQDSSGFSTLVKARPLLSNKSLTANSEKLFQSLMHHSEVSFKTEAPSFSLPRRAEEAEFANTLRHAINDFGGVCTNNIDCMYGFQYLMLELVDNSLATEDVVEVTHRIPSDCRKLSDVQLLLSRLGSTVKNRQQHRDVSTAMKSAIESGDVDAACSLAVEARLPQLAMALASSAESRSDLQHYLGNGNGNHGSHRQNDSNSILRYYADNTSTGLVTSKDWVHFLLGQLQKDHFQSLPDLVEMCESSKNFPFPGVRCLDERRSGKSVLYILLCLFNGQRRVGLIDALNPLGYSSHAHDYSFSFLFAISIGACHRNGFLDSFVSSDVVETIVDSYATQLTSEGRWDLAILAVLYDVHRLSPDRLARRANYAKCIVVRNYRGSDEQSSRNKAILVKWGVAEAWFEEALAYQCAYTGLNAYDFVRHTLSFDFETGYRAFQELILPSIFFKSRSEIDEMVILFSSTVNSSESNQTSLPAAILKLIELKNAVENNDIATDDSIYDTRQSYRLIEEAFAVYENGCSTTYKETYLSTIFSTKVCLPAMIVEAKQLLRYVKANIEAPKMCFTQQSMVIDA